MTRRKRRTGYEDEICIEFLLAERLRISPHLYFDICLKSEVMFFNPPSFLPPRKHSILNQILCPHSGDGGEDSVGQICGLLRSKRTAPRGAVEKLTPVSCLRSSGTSQRERISPFQYFISVQVNSIVIEEV